MSLVQIYEDRYTEEMKLMKPHHTLGPPLKSQPGKGEGAPRTPPPSYAVLVKCESSHISPRWRGRGNKEVEMFRIEGGAA